VRPDAQALKREEAKKDVRENEARARPRALRRGAPVGDAARGRGGG